VTLTPSKLHTDLIVKVAKGLLTLDIRFFNISPREASQIDPAQRIALMTAYEAIEQAGIVPDATPSTRRDRVGVFVSRNLR
jgi:acyl transferase domain-containing protein